MLWLQDADIIILEFAFNDNYAGVSLQSPERAAYERVRRAGWLLMLAGWLAGSQWLAAGTAGHWLG